MATSYPAHGDFFHMLCRVSDRNWFRMIWFLVHPLDPLTSEQRLELGLGPARDWVVW